MHPSRNGNYMSISVKEMMLDVDSIIEKYEKSAEIKGVITL
jgi:putative lipoic acid-binding regulatory protein